MIDLKPKLTGNFLEKMGARIERWSGQRLGARLDVPDELRWWYWQEFGTAGPYKILPIAGKYLAFPGANGKTVIVTMVEHPGIKARRMVQKVLPEIRQETFANIAVAFAQGGVDNPALVGEAMVEAALTAKDLIVGSIEINLTGTRADGRLLGQTAGAVFSNAATVVGLTST